MKHRLRLLVEAVLKQVPLARAAYVQRDLLQAQVASLQAGRSRPNDRTAEPQSPPRLENAVPITRSIEERILIAQSCRDADAIPKVANAGMVVERPGADPIQIMFNGVRVVAGGYYGAWMQNLITSCHGHHEPQEEAQFAEILRHLPHDASMIELGGYWSFYSIWFLTQDRRRRSFVVEADPNHLAVGRANAKLNDVEPTFIAAFVGATDAPPSPFRTESCGELNLPRVSVARLMDSHGIDKLDVLHCDAQGVELAVIQSCLGLAASDRLNWLVISTHSHHISGDPLTHQKCLAGLLGAGATVLAEHDVHESFSGDGLIVAKFGAVPIDWIRPKLSYNRYSSSLFRNPLYDLAQMASDRGAG